MRTKSSHPAHDDVFRAFFRAQDPEKRLGGTLGAEEIKAHPWFSDINWALILHKPPVDYQHIWQVPDASPTQDQKLAETIVI